MRRWPILLAATFLSACAPPHPTHPTKVDCRLEVETRFSARVDTSSPGTIRNGPDPCSGGGVVVNQMDWTQRGTTNVSVCVAAGTTPEQAASLCSHHLEATGRNVGNGAPPLTARPPSGRICPGSLNVVSSLIISTGGTPALYPNECREGTTLPLLP
ncbi:MAG TPA: hypothetical protein VM911_04820 [Pyrinomonadaceae bacterium]|jgi:hypothetical protein|nr:hypothetical protein [Pyrinomonadaceae bacterium]